MYISALKGIETNFFCYCFLSQLLSFALFDTKVMVLVPERSFAQTVKIDRYINENFRLNRNKTVHLNVD